MLNVFKENNSLGFAEYFSCYAYWLKYKRAILDIAYGWSQVFCLIVKKLYNWDIFGSQ